MIIYVAVLVWVLVSPPSSYYSRNTLLTFVILTIFMTSLRLYGVGKALRFLDVIITCAFCLMLFGLKVGNSDIIGFLMVAIIGFLTMCVGGPSAWFAGGIVLAPLLLQLWERWEFQKGYWFEILLCLSLVIMIILICLPDSDSSELTFLIFSFFSKAIIVAFVTS